MILRGNLVTDLRWEVYSNAGSCKEDKEDDSIAVNSSTVSVPLATLPSSEINARGTAGSSTDLPIRVWCSLKQLKVTFQAPQMLAPLSWYVM